MTPSRITTDIAGQLVQIVRETARHEILPHFRSLDASGLTTKTSQNDLVTIADRAAERRIADAAGALFPTALIVGEEAVSDDPDLAARLADAELAIIIDPIDGTWNYARGLPLFGVNLAVVEDGKTIFGLHHDPVTDSWIEARLGAGTHRWDAAGYRQRLLIDAEVTTSAGLIPTALPRRAGRARWASLVADYERIGALGCSCHDYWLLAEGAVDFMFADQVRPWDHAAGVLLYSEAGGYGAILSDGAPYSVARRDGPLLCARSPRLWDALRDKFLMPHAA